MFYDGLLMKDFLHWHLFCDNNVFIFPTFLFGFCILISFKQQMTQQCCFAHYKVTRHVSELKKRQNIIFNATFNRVTILIRNMWNPCHFSISFNFSDQAAYITYLMLLYLPWQPLHKLKWVLYKWMWWYLQSGSPKWTRNSAPGGDSNMSLQNLALCSC